MAALLCLHHEAINLDLYLFCYHLYTKHLVLVFGNKEAFYIVQDFLAKGHSMTSQLQSKRGKWLCNCRNRRAALSLGKNT